MEGEKPPPSYPSGASTGSVLGSTMPRAPRGPRSAAVDHSLEWGLLALPCAGQSSHFESVSAGEGPGLLLLPPIASFKSTSTVAASNTGYDVSIVLAAPENVRPGERQATAEDPAVRCCTCFTRITSDRASGDRAARRKWTFCCRFPQGRAPSDSMFGAPRVDVFVHVRVRRKAHPRRPDHRLDERLDHAPQLVVLGIVHASFQITGDRGPRGSAACSRGSRR